MTYKSLKLFYFFQTSDFFVFIYLFFLNFNILSLNFKSFTSMLAYVTDFLSITAVWIRSNTATTKSHTTAHIEYA